MFQPSVKIDRGSAYLAVFLALTLVLALAAGAYFSALSEMFSTRWKKKEIMAEYAAEAGLREVLYRLNLRNNPALPAGGGGSAVTVNGTAINAFIGENTLDSSFPRTGWRVSVLSCIHASLPPEVPPFYYTISLQGTPCELDYTIETWGEESLEVSYLKDEWDADGDGDFSEVVFHDPSLPADGLDNLNSLLLGGDGTADNESPFNLHAAGLSPSGLPAVTIRSTGRFEDSAVTMETAAVRKAMIRPLMPAALTAGTSVGGAGDILVSGFNHGGGVDPAGTGSPCGLSYFGDGIDNNGDGADDASEINFPYDCFHSPGAHNAGIASASVGLPAGTAIGVPWAQTSGTGILSIWEYLGLSQAAWDEMVDSGTEDSFPGDGRDAIFVVGAPGTTAYLSGAGSGLIHSPGSLELASDFVFRGVVYAEEDIEINGSPWICGAVIAGGAVTLDGYHPGMPLTILFSAETVENLTRFVPYRMLGRAFKERY